MGSQPWHGLLVANPVLYDDGLTVDADRYAEHVSWLAASGCHGITPNGSLGEYQALTDAERSLLLEAAVAAAGPGFAVIPGVAAYGALEAARWAEHAAKVGAAAVMLLPPNAYRADEASVVGHFRTVASVGLPVIAYNNPIDTRVDLTPGLLHRLFGEGLIVAVKEFSGDPRRAYEIAELTPGLDVLAGSDDVVVELALAGASGWISGYANVFPHSCQELFTAAATGNAAAAGPLYRVLHPLLRWDSKSEFVQAIKLSMDLVGRYGGPCRPPRQPLEPASQDSVRDATKRATDHGCR